MCEIDYESSSYGEALGLRHRLLRKPLGLEWSAEELRAERRDRHFGLVEDGTVVACVTVRALGDGRVKLRQMAVETARQGAGLARTLLAGLEEVLVAEGVRGWELHAREEAVGFYEKLGFAVEGEPFREVGLRHRRMVKGEI